MEKNNTDAYEYKDAFFFMVGYVGAKINVLNSSSYSRTSICDLYSILSEMERIDYQIKKGENWVVGKMPKHHHK